MSLHILFIAFLLSSHITISYSSSINNKIPKSDVDLIEFALNLEFLEAEFFCNSVFGYGLDVLAPELAEGGPPPIGAQLALLDYLTRDIITQFCLQEAGHIRFSLVSSLEGQV
jgi:hypothetical protein